MAVGFDAVGPSATPASSAASTTLSWSHTVGASGTYLLVMCGIDVVPDTGFSATAKYNGTLMTSLGTVHANNSADGFIQVWGMASPPTGSALTVLITVSGGTPDDLNGGSISFTGATALSAIQTATTGGSSGSLAFSPTTSGNMVALFIGAGGTITMTGGGFTSKFNGGSGSDQVEIVEGLIEASTGGTMTPTWTIASAQWSGMIALEVQVSGAATTAPTQFRAAVRPPGLQSPAAWEDLITPQVSPQPPVPPVEFSPQSTARPPGRRSPSAWADLTTPQTSVAFPVPPPPAYPPVRPPGRQSPAAWEDLITPQASVPLPADAHITGVAAEVDVQGGVGTFAAAAPIQGVAAEVDVSGGTGVPFGTQTVFVTATRPPGLRSPSSWGDLTTTRASLPIPLGSNIPGVPAQVQVQGGVGTFEGDAPVTGVAAEVDVQGGVGTFAAGANITGVAAQVQVQGGTGVPFGTATVFVTATRPPGLGSPSTWGDLTTTRASLPIPLGSNIQGVAAEVDVQGGVGVPFGTQTTWTVANRPPGRKSPAAWGDLTTSWMSLPLASGGNITGNAAEVDVTGGIGTLSAGQNLTGVAAEVDVSGGVGTFAGGANVTGVAAEVDVSGGTGVPFGTQTTWTVANRPPGRRSPAAWGELTTTRASLPIPVGSNVLGVAAEVDVTGGVGAFAAAAAVLGVAAEVDISGGVGTVFVSGTRFPGAVTLANKNASPAGLSNRKAGAVTVTNRNAAPVTTSNSKTGSVTVTNQMASKVTVQNKV